jgi:hypothetical protein
MKQEMEGFLQKNKETRNIDVKERKEIDDFYNTQLVTDLIDLYSEPLMHLYKYYTLQGNISLGGNLEKRMNVIEFTNWVKFGTCTNITPHLMTSKDMEAIYRLLERDMMSVEEEKQEEEKEDKDINYIDFEHFKKGLIRITILSKTQSIEHEIKKRRIQPKSQSTAKVSSNLGDKNKTNKKLQDLEAQIAKIENLNQIKVEDKRVSKEFDVSLINVDDVEKLLKFLQLNPDDDKYTMDRKMTNKAGYPKTIVFDGLEGGYSDNKSVKDTTSSYSRKRADSGKYSVIHSNKENIEEIAEEKKSPKQNIVKGTKENRPVKEDIVEEAEEKKPAKQNFVKEADEEIEKELVAVSEDDLNNQPSDARLENIIAPEGAKEEWKVDDE